VRVCVYVCVYVYIYADIKLHALSTIYSWYGITHRNELSVLLSIVNYYISQETKVILSGTFIVPYNNTKIGSLSINRHKMLLQLSNIGRKT
jgi:hypothetical protein